MEKLLHTPEGVRDIYNVECGKKLALENRLKKTLHLFGSVSYTHLNEIAREF